jgi:hypothetical protein
MKQACKLMNRPVDFDKWAETSIPLGDICIPGFDSPHAYIKIKKVICSE